MTRVLRWGASVCSQSIHIQLLSAEDDWQVNGIAQGSSQHVYIQVLKNFRNKNISALTMWYEVSCIVLSLVKKKTQVMSKMCLKWVSSKLILNLNNVIKTNTKLKLIATAKALMLECGEAPKSSLLAVTLLYVVCRSLPPLSVSLNDLQLSHVCIYVFGDFSLTIEILSNMETKLWS